MTLEEQWILYAQRETTGEGSVGWASQCSGMTLRAETQRILGLRLELTDDAERRLLVQQHYAAAARGDMDGVHTIYHDDAVIEYRQSEERILGREKLRGLRESYPATLDFSIRRIVGSAATCGSRSTSSTTTESP